MTGDGISKLQVVEAAEVALEGGDEVVPIASLFISAEGLRWAPVKAIFIHDHVVVEVIILVWCVAAAVPHAPARGPVQPGCRKVGAEHPVHLLTCVPTDHARSCPGPECLGAA
jgi:hypothetical protein